MTVRSSIVVVGLASLAVLLVFLAARPLLSDRPSSGGSAGSSSTLPGGAGASSGRTSATGAPAPSGASSSAPRTRPSRPAAPRGTVTAETDPAASGAARAETLPGLDPGPSSADPLVSRPLPPAGQARGRLVAGYPHKSLPPAPGSRIITSSVSVAGSRLQTGLVATATGGEKRLLRFYRSTLVEAGLREVPTTAVGGSSAAAFRSGRNSVTVTVTPGDGRTAYSVFAILAAPQA